MYCLYGADYKIYRRYFEKLDEFAEYANGQGYSIAPATIEKLKKGKASKKELEKIKSIADEIWAKIIYYEQGRWLDCLGYFRGGL